MLTLKIKLKEHTAQNMPEYMEGMAAKRSGKSFSDCPYAIYNTKSKNDAEWENEFKLKFDAWMHGFTSNQNNLNPISYKY